MVKVRKHSFKDRSGYILTSPHHHNCWLIGAGSTLAGLIRRCLVALRFIAERLGRSDD